MLAREIQSMPPSPELFVPVPLSSPPPVPSPSSPPPSVPFTSSDTHFTNDNTDISNISSDTSGDGDQGGTSAALIITFEVVFSVFVFCVVAGCYIFGIHRRNRLKRMQQEQEMQAAAAQTVCTESMLERAFQRHERRLFDHFYTPTRHNSSTSIEQQPQDPPPYWPPDPLLQLPERAVTRLSQALLVSSLHPLPKYSDLDVSSSSPPSYPPSSSDNHAHHHPT
ncbi:hypothetical protein BCR43DRAFT_486660 [Syncephalastrum racemosum]|uniref:Uncharacterized protein n=1 Tax=Syncephalastrum racemosum TaxID=13706 RepID=A0A1X2HPJ5_SYNRA|nr:hypothetical protein BCR43DRAFT_486660 [Syncephalastrum racemosum]